jgi:hypothetical protein
LLQKLGWQQISKKLLADLRDDDEVNKFGYALNKCMDLGQQKKTSSTHTTQKDTDWDKVMDAACWQDMEDFPDNHERYITTEKLLGMLATSMDKSQCAAALGIVLNVLQDGVFLFFLISPTGAFLQIMQAMLQYCKV